MTHIPQSESHDILVVEDSATQAEQLKFTLEQHGYEVRLARHGEEGLVRLQERLPLLVISDINMPEMNGYEFCRRIRSEPRFADLPVILLTSLSDPEDVVHGLECGADNFVTKPLDEGYLLSRIRYIMANRHLRSLESTRISLEITLGGRKHQITADRLQMLHLLLSTYESAVLRSRQLVEAQEQLRRLNEGLEEKIRERTAELTAEVAERARLNEELKESEEKYRHLFASSPLPMWVYDVETLRFLAVNDAAVRSYGYSRAEFLELTIRDIRPPEQVPALTEHLAEFKADLVAGAWTHRKKNGAIIRVEVTAHELDFAGRRARLVLANDVTERWRADEARRASEERFSALFHYSPVPKLIGAADGLVLDTNEEFCKFSGYAPDEFVGSPLDQLPIWQEPEAKSKTMEAIRSRNPLRNAEIAVRRKAGETRTALVSIQVLQLAEKPLFLATFVDITERKALEDQLNRVQRVESVGLLASGIAHDMNNILAPIMMGAPLLRMDLSPAEREKTVTTIEISAQRGANLVRQLLIFGRGVEGERRPVVPADIATEVAKIAWQTFPRNITICNDVPGNVWLIHGDATQLHQVLLNLCVNARDAMPQGGVVTISAENADIDAHYAAQNADAKPGRYTMLRVSDTGTGIPPEIAARIFDPFFTTKEPGKGTGLGLSTVLGIVKSHGGFVRLHTEPAKGTTFELYFPASPDAVPLPVGPGAGREDLRGNGELVLVVDDEEQIRRIVRDMLTRQNYRVVTAQDGVEATAVFASTEGVRVVITDLDMPLMDGVNLTRVLRQMDPKIEIVISTGFTGRGGKREAELESLGVSAILDKPYTAEKLLRVVHRIITGGNATPGEGAAAERVYP